MKTQKNAVNTNKQCTCSAIQQCDMHRKPRTERIEGQAQQLEQNAKDMSARKKTITKGEKK